MVIFWIISKNWKNHDFAAAYPNGQHLNSSRKVSKMYTE